MAFSEKQCAKHLTKAIIQFFITENPPASLISDCADFYYKNNYHTLSLLKFLFQHPFVVNNNFSKKVKTPVELLVYFQRQTGFRTVGPKTNTFFLLKTSQILYNLRNTLSKNGFWNNTVVFVYSEFGRTIDENQNLGTDHGSASFCMLLGGNLKESMPSSQTFRKLPENILFQKYNLLQETIDFRDLYSQLISYLG